MKAIPVYPGKVDSARITDVPRPTVTDVPDGRGVLGRVLRVGLDGTDKEINAPPDGSACCCPTEHAAKLSGPSGIHRDALAGLDWVGFPR
ncbi:hypothetical protein Psi02_70660 [Planotetraspora silvatica]|uniref:Uncharacterized protein n=1 Tax=Planotetraspora silvatica TaxID=234614 RepID=A0A8J3USR4_9ACTN|nr:hypothetical protein [Planotetraspora silvatica]GII50642.1 hypothetical protein Psi02_70660 [Planotetraspora silvatica]